jgi:alpha-beta hydrolase superfamily lysophospholipase
MSREARWLLQVMAVSGLVLCGRGAESQESVSFLATDGAGVHGYWYRTDGLTPRAVILAFHQGGADGRGEYGPIAPRLNASGYDVLAIDQRAGGDLFGQENRTAAEHGETSYCEAAGDIAGALRFARQEHPDLPIVLWGSSYSGALALRLAATNPEGVVGALGFSPASGGPMAECRAEDVSERIEVPVMVLRPERELEMESAQSQFEVFREQGHRTFVARPGTHGSSMLVEERVEAEVEATWGAVLAFLHGVSGPR